MIELAQDMIKALQERLRATIHVAADLAESVGVPPTVTSILHRIGGLENEFDGGFDGGFDATYQPPPPPPPPAPAPVVKEAAAPTPPAPKPKPAPAKPKKRSGDKRRELSGKELPKNVRPLKADDAVKGSTYLARIIWSLGVSELEDIGPLRPADIAKMIMARSPISLEPPNVARYIRRSKPTTITVDHKEGNSSFYKLTAKGHGLFKEKFLK